MSLFWRLVFFNHYSVIFDPRCFSGFITDIFIAVLWWTGDMRSDPQLGRGKVKRSNSSAFLSSSTPAADTTLPAVTMVWQYVGQLVFNMLILTGLVKGADRIVKEMLGL